MKTGRTPANAEVCVTGPFFGQDCTTYAGYTLCRRDDTQGAGIESGVALVSCTVALSVRCGRAGSDAAFSISVVSGDAAGPEGLSPVAVVSAEADAVVSLPFGAGVEVVASAPAPVSASPGVSGPVVVSASGVVSGADGASGALPVVSPLSGEVETARLSRACWPGSAVVAVVSDGYDVAPEEGADGEGRVAVSPVSPVSRAG